MPEDRIRKILKISKVPMSMETRIGDEDDVHLGDLFEDASTIAPIDAAISALLRHRCRDVLREAKVLRLRFGIGMNTDLTLERSRQAVQRHTGSYLPDRSQGPVQATASFALRQASGASSKTDTVRKEIAKLTAANGSDLGWFLQFIHFLQEGSSARSKGKRRSLDPAAFPVTSSPNATLLYFVNPDKPAIKNEARTYPIIL